MKSEQNLNEFVERAQLAKCVAAEIISEADAENMGRLSAAIENILQQNPRADGLCALAAVAACVLIQGCPDLLVARIAFQSLVHQYSEAALREMRELESDSFSSEDSEIQH